MKLPWRTSLELCKAIWTYPHAAQELGAVLNEASLEPPLGSLAVGLSELWRIHRTAPTEGLLRQWVENKMEGVLLGAAVERIQDVQAASTPPEGWAVQEGRRIAAAALLERLAGHLPALAEEGRYDEALREVRKAAAMAAPAGELTSGAGTEDEILDRQTEKGERIATRIHRLDTYLHGGLKRGEQGHILGRKGGGKSHCLIHMAAEAAESGHNVLFASLEMSASEVRARLDRHWVNDFGPDFVKKLPGSVNRLRQNHDRMHVLVKKGLALGALASAIERLPKKPDMVVIDYLQLMQTGVRPEGDDFSGMRRRALGQLSQELHDLAQEHDVALWTAYQTNRAGMLAVNQNGVLDITHYAEAIDAAWPAAVVVSVNQTVEEACNRTGRLFLAENRGGEKLKTIESMLDWRTSKIVDACDPSLPSQP